MWGVQLITLKSGVIAWREQFLKRVVYINLITFVAAYIVARGCGGMDICCSRSIFNIAI